MPTDYDVQIAKKLLKEMGKGTSGCQNFLEWLDSCSDLRQDWHDYCRYESNCRAERNRLFNSYYTSEPVLLVRKDGKYASAKTLEDFQRR